MLIRELTSMKQTPKFGGTGLVVDDDLVTSKLLGFLHVQ